MEEKEPVGPLERLTGLVELITTLDRRVIGALDSLDKMEESMGTLEDMQRSLGSLDEMQRSISTLDELRGASGDLVADLKARIAATDERLNRDLDEVKAAILAKIGELDLAGLGPRLDRLEKALLNVERATVNLDHSVEGALEALPGFAQRRVKDGKESVAADQALSEEELGH